MAGTQLSETEWKVMNVVWQHTGPVSARAVLDEVGAETGWAYTTVKTMMDRLVDKGVLSGQLKGNTVLYTARLSRNQARRDAARGLISKAFDGAAGPLVHYLISAEKLSDDEREELREMLARQENDTRGANRRRSAKRGDG